MVRCCAALSLLLAALPSLALSRLLRPPAPACCSLLLAHTASLRHRDEWVPAHSDRLQPFRSHSLSQRSSSSSSAAASSSPASASSQAPEGQLYCTPYGPRYGTGDTIGVLFDQQRARVWFTCNGV